MSNLSEKEIFTGQCCQGTSIQRNQCIYVERVVVFDGTAPEKTGPNFEDPDKGFSHQIIE